MYLVSVKDDVRFHLRINLLHLPGATNFESLRTVNSVVYVTFIAAASARGRLELDDEWDGSLFGGWRYPSHANATREMFAYICCFSQPSRPIKLWENHIINLALDINDV